MKLGWRAYSIVPHIGTPDALTLEKTGSLVCSNVTSGTTLWGPNVGNNLSNVQKILLTYPYG